MVNWMPKAESKNKQEMGQRQRVTYWEWEGAAYLFI